MTSSAPSSTASSRPPSPIRVLVTGDLACEGVNLHAQCHEQIHFDVPWSLIRIEQRNGRIDRYGQRHAPQITTLLLNPNAPQFSGDLRVLSRLIEREHAAHAALGDVASLLGRYDVGPEEDEIRKVLASQANLDDVVQEPEKVAAENSIVGLLAGSCRRPASPRRRGQIRPPPAGRRRSTPITPFSEAVTLVAASNE